MGFSSDHGHGGNRKEGSLALSPRYRPGQGRRGQLSDSSPSGFIRVWLEHDSDHLSCPSPEGSVRNSSTLTLRLEEVGCRLSPACPHCMQSWEPGTEILMGSAVLGMGVPGSVGLFLEESGRPLEIGTSLVLKTMWHPFLMSLVPFYYQRSTRGASCPFSGLEFTDIP